MLRLMVIRHAKSSWNSDAQTDHARPLNKRGRRDAPRVGEHLAELGWTPELVLCSDSMRTRETWKLMREAFHPDPDVRYSRKLYHADVGNFVDAVAAVPKTFKTVAVIGHNTGWEEVVEMLCGDYHRMTTCNAALFELDEKKWTRALTRAGDWKLVDLVRPKEI